MSSTTIATEYVSCDLCGADDQELLYSRLDPITGQEFHLVECKCGMAFVNPMPNPESVPDLYPRDYLKDKKYNTGMYRKMMKYLPAAGGNLLDIGCGRGDFIHFAAAQGWKVEGVDLLSWENPYNLSVRVGDFLRMDLPERHYDVITAWALLEHVRKPSLFFEKVAGLLIDGGSFVFIVPNYGAPGLRHCCTEDVPRHLHLFTPRAVNAYLLKYGMKAVAIHHDDSIYTAYPFGLVRYGILRMMKKETRCSRYENRSVVLLRNRQIRGNAAAWLAEVARKLNPLDILVDAVDLGIGIMVAKASKRIGNYGVMTVVATTSSQKKSNPNEEDC